MSNVTVEPTGQTDSDTELRPLSQISQGDAGSDTEEATVSWVTERDARVSADCKSALDVHSQRLVARAAGMRPSSAVDPAAEALTPTMMGRITGIMGARASGQERKAVPEWER
eukprot:3813243-Rhodomonas_salina.1